MGIEKIRFVEDGEEYWFDPESMKYHYQGDLEVLSVTLKNIRGTATKIESGFDDPSKWDEFDASPGSFTPERLVYSPEKAQQIVLDILEDEDPIDEIRLSE